MTDIVTRIEGALLDHEDASMMAGRDWLMSEFERKWAEKESDPYCWSAPGSHHVRPMFEVLEDVPNCDTYEYNAERDVDPLATWTPEAQAYREDAERTTIAESIAHWTATYAMRVTLRSAPQLSAVEEVANSYPRQFALVDMGPRVHLARARPS